MKKFTQKIFCFLFVLFTTSTFAGNYSWTGATSVSWSNSANWSPTGVPSTNDSVTISNQTNSPQLNANTTVKKFTINSDTLDLKTYTLTVSSTGSLNGGTILNGLFYSSAGSTFTFSGTSFRAKVKITASTFALNGSIFNDSVVINKSSKGSNLVNKGGNTFNGYFSIDMISGSVVFADSLPDIFNSNLNASGGGTYYFAHRATGNQFNGDINLSGIVTAYFNYYGTATFNGNIHFKGAPAFSNSIYFGYSTGSSTLSSGKTIVLDSTILFGNLYFRNFTQSGTDSLNFELDSLAQIFFESGCVFNGVLNAASSIHLDGAKFLGPTYLTNIAHANLTSLGGCYFGNHTTIINRSSSAVTYTLGGTIADTFATASTIQNISGIISINNAIYNDSITLNNADSSTTSNMFILNNTGESVFYGDVFLENNTSGMLFGTDGEAILRPNKTIKINGNPTGNVTIKNFTQEGNGPQTFDFTTSASSKLILEGNNTFNGDFTFWGQNIEIKETVFNGAVQVTKLGSNDVTLSGGNVFNSTVMIKDSSTSGHYLKMGNTSPDYYHGNVTFIQKGAGKLYPAYNTTSYFSGNITVDGTSSISFCNNNGKVVIDGSSSSSISKSSSYAPSFKKIAINKSSGSFTLNTPITISDSLFFQKGIINADATNLISLSNGGKITGASDTSFVNGPFKKIGNAAFVFPVGFNSFYTYRPIEMTAPTTSTDAYTGQYVHQAQTFGTPLDTSIEHLNTCEYWKLTRNAGTSKVRIKINWNHDSCDFVNPLYMRVAGWDGSLWKDLRQNTYSGDSIKGSLTTLDSVTSMSVFATALKRCINFRDVITKHDVYCHGSADGIALVALYKGTPPYKYSWSNSMGTRAETPNLLSAGKYTISISDSLQCYLSDTIVINEPDPLTISFTKTHSSCRDSTSTVSVSATGGTGVEKKYLWNIDGVTSQIHENLPAGEYTVLVIDSNACAVFGNVQVSDDNGPGVSLDTMISVTCFGGHNGSAIIDITSGNDPFKIKWSNADFDTLEEIANVRGGFYSVKVTDSVGCITFETIEITQPDTFKLTVNIENTHCGSHEGSATAEVIGGTQPYYYSWTSSSSTENYINNLNSGEDTVSVTDNHGCYISNKFEILDIGGINVTGHVISNESCFLSSSGSARVTVSGGATPYTYLWYPRGGDNDTAINLITDLYTVTVTDANGCRQKTNITIGSPDELKAYIFTTPPSSDSSSDGKANSIVYGGTQPYYYSWSSGQSSSLISGLSSMNDTLTVTDSHGCIAINTTTIRTVISCYPGKHTDQHYCGPFNNSCSSCTTYVEKNIVNDFGATGDGITNDECAFEAASDFFTQINPTVPKKLIIPLGTYIIGSQDMPWPSHGNDVLFFDNMGNITIEGELNWTYFNGEPVYPPEMPKLKFDDCLKYGAFDLPFNPENRLLSCEDIPPCDPGGTLSGLYCRIMTPGTMIHFGNCYNVTVSNLDLDGNIDNIVVGGRYTEGIQIPCDGIFVNASQNVTINNVNAHHFGHDGIVIYYMVCPATLLDEYPLYLGPLMNMTINNSKFSNNCRTGLVWGGGRGLHINDCEFNLNGQGRFYSKWAAGIDIEFEGSNVGNIKGEFNNCKFKYNKLVGMICDAGGPYRPTQDFFSRNFLFNNCTFVGSETGATAQPNSRNFTFDNCFFYGRTWNAFYSPIPGSTYNSDNTKFVSCHFFEEYTDPDIFPLTRKSISVGHDLDPGTTNISAGCPHTDHNWCVEFSKGLRVLMQDCDIITNFNLKTINLSADVVPPFYPTLNLDSWNIFEGIHIKSYGLNSCGCGLPFIGCGATTLNSLNFVELRNFDSDQNDWGALRNPSLSCGDPTYTCGFSYIYSDNSVMSDPSGGILHIWHCLSSGFGCFLREEPGAPNWYPLSEEYYNPIDPHSVNLFPVSSDCDVVTRFTTIGQPLHVICNPPNNKMRNPILKNSENEISIFPNPATDNLRIDNAVIGSEIKIYSVLGELIYIQKIMNSSFEINIRKFESGVFIIRTENSNSYRFIKL